MALIRAVAFDFGHTLVDEQRGRLRSSGLACRSLDARSV